MNLQPIEDILATQERINREKAALLNSGNPAAFVQPYVPPDSGSPANIIAITGAQRGPAPVRGQNESWESFQDARLIGLISNHRMHPMNWKPI